MSVVVQLPDGGRITFSHLGSPEALRLFVALLSRLPQDVLEHLRDECAGWSGANGIAERFILDELWRRHNAQ